MEEHKDLKQSEIVLTRRDVGAVHASSRFGGASKGCIIRFYRLNGEFVGECGTIREAIEMGSKMGYQFTYTGIYLSLTGRQKSYAGFLWRSNKGVGRGHKDF